MKRKQNTWHLVDVDEPPLNTTILCFNGIAYPARWNGYEWNMSNFELSPKRLPPTHWRELPNLSSAWEEFYFDVPMLPEN